MENFSKNDSDNENEESKKIINNFKSELEKIIRKNHKMIKGKIILIFIILIKIKLSQKKKK